MKEPAVIELEVVGVTAPPKSDEEKQRLRAELMAQALAVQPDPPMSDEQRQRLQESLQMLADQPEHRLMLRERTGKRVLEFGIGAPEAMAIATALRGDQQPRPMTHDLIGNLLGALDDVTVLRMIITKREPETNGGPVAVLGTPAHPPPGTFYAALELTHRGHVIAVDCRPSDGIAVAVRLGVPIVAANAVEPVLATA